MRVLLTVLIPTSALAGIYGIALAHGEQKLWPALAMALLLIAIGFLIMYKRK